jgi:hypothetical protein
MGRFAALLAVLVLVASLPGCGTTSERSTGGARAIGDVRALNGTWTGFQTGRSFGARQPLTIVISDGTYVASFGKGFSSTGTVAVTDGKVEIVRTGGSGGGGATLTATSTAIVEERDGRRVLVGHGRNDLGPFSYELTEQK